MESIPIKIVMVGDSTVGKTSLQYTFEHGHFPDEYLPIIFSSYSLRITLSKEKAIFLVYIWDTQGNEDYDRLRPLSYPQTNIFLLCFSLVSRKTFNNIASKWIKEVRNHLSDVPVILVGLKSDLRINTDTNQSDSISNSDLSDSLKDQIPIQSYEIDEMIEKIGAIKYFECSSKENINVYDVFEFSCRYFYHHIIKTKKSRCIIE